jgi:DNA repair photolyase
LIRPRLAGFEVTGDRLCKELAKQKKKVLFRFTIGSLNENQCAFWEPGAPKPEERIKSLKHAFNAGFKTSVSVEPMLDDNVGTLELVRAVDPYVTDTIWIGKMQRVPKIRNAHIDGFETRLAFIKEWQKDENILRLVKTLGANKKVKWKDSIKKVLKKHKKL